MPCYDGGPSDGGTSEIARLKERNDHLAQIICAISDKLESEYPILLDELLQGNKQYREWLLAHKKFDAARKAAAKKREEKEHREKLERAKKVLDSLSADERKEMGL